MADPKPDALAAADPAPATPVKADPFASALVLGKAPVGPTGVKAEPKPAPVEPDDELAKVVAIARATCGCEACGRLITRTAAGRQQTRGGERPASCMAGEVFAALVARGRS